MTPIDATNRHNVTRCVKLKFAHRLTMEGSVMATYNIVEISYNVSSKVTAKSKIGKVFADKAEAWSKAAALNDKALDAFCTLSKEDQEKSIIKSYVVESLIG
jgi:hypothetical protein